jgi:osmotically-inducible protein OsmY
MADRYPDHGDYGRDKNRGRFSRDQRWSDDDDWRRRSRDRQSFGGREEDDDDRRGYGAYGGGYGQGMSGNYAGGYDRSRGGSDDDVERGGYGGSYGQGGMRGQSYGAGYRDRDEYDRSYGLEGSSYDQRGQRLSQGSQRGARGQDYGGQQGLAGFGAYEEGGSFGQGRPGMGGQGYERTNQDYGGYAGSFGQGGSLGQGGGNFGPSGGFGSEQSGGYLTRGGRREWGRHSGRGPKNYTRSDDRIREDVNDRLTDDPHLDASEIDVKVSSCEVTLTGTVESREAKRRAEDCVESVSGVKNVQNNLRIQASSEDESTRTTTGGGKKNKAGGDGEQRIQ